MPMLKFGSICVFSIDNRIPVVEIYSKYCIDHTEIRMKCDKRVGLTITIQLPGNWKLRSSLIQIPRRARYNVEACRNIISKSISFDWVSASLILFSLLVEMLHQYYFADYEESFSSICKKNHLLQLIPYINRLLSALIGHSPCHLKVPTLAALQELLRLDPDTNHT
ncbi:unnamed protein product [Albugo candida]|uniref:Uncharacterized protein n=1 Tax=Albugo candida TaxID=65357 RepID=A0A024FWE6_9STRA|nr:unnamed protein product [Albugo candida]|eukprot:CCI10969.1 unnamed protein product [Albugo candida]